MSFIPKGYTNFESTGIFTNESVPKVLLEPHYTRKGVYGQVHVLNGHLKFFGYKNGTQSADKEVLIKANETAMAHPYYLHRLEPASEDLEFEIRFFSLAEPETNQNETESETQMAKQK
jgi:tellurite resistance-related uncharacterized protein